MTKPKKISKKIMLPVENTNLPSIKVLSIKDNPDGSALMEFEYDEIFVKAFILANPNKKPTKSNIGKWIIKLLKSTLDDIEKNETL